MGIFHLVFSYSGKITLSVLADRDIMPDPEAYHDLLVASYQEVFQAAVGRAAPGRAAVGRAAPGPAVRARPKARRKPPAKAKAKTAKKTSGKGPRAKARPRRAASSR